MPLEQPSIYASFPSSSVVVPKPVWHFPSAASRLLYDRLKDAHIFSSSRFCYAQAIPAMSQCLIGLEPIISSESKVLILGTFPGEESLRPGEYFANSRNQFWTIMDHLFGGILAVEYEHRINILKEKVVALWNLLRQRERDGSPDANIDENTTVINDFQSLFDHYPKLRVIFFNGEKAERMFQQHVAPTQTAKGRFD